MSSIVLQSYHSNPIVLIEVIIPSHFICALFYLLPFPLLQLLLLLVLLIEFNLLELYWFIITIILLSF
jgi:hypothetical protein